MMRNTVKRTMLASCCACLVLSAAGQALAESWRVEEVGVPINAVNYENSGGVLAAGPGGGGTTFYTSYYRSTWCELVGYDFRRAKAVRRRLPSRGGYGLAVGADGCVYIGGVIPGDLHRYDPKTDAMQTINVHSFGVQYIWDVDVAGSGVVYCAAGYPKTRLVAFDPKVGRAQDLGEMVVGQQYLRSLCVDSKGKVWCGVGMTAHLIVYDPADGSKREVLPKEYQASSSAYDLVAVGNYVVASISFDGVLLIYDAGEGRVVRTIPRPAGQISWMISAGGTGQTAYVRTLPDQDAYRCDLRTGELKLLAKGVGQVKVVEADRWLHAVDDQCYVVYDVQAGKEVARQQLTEGGDGMDVFSLTSGADGQIYGSTYINMHMFRCEPATKKLTDLGKVMRWAGQVDSLSLGSDGRIYIGAYTNAVMAVYDPRRPWRFGLDAEANPREIGPVGKGQYRTRANCLGPDGRIYVGSIPSYRSAETGAFTICDPKTGAMDMRLDFVKGGTVDAVVADDRYVYGGGGGEFFAYDPATKEKRFRQERAVSALVVVKGGKVVGSGGGKLFVYDRQRNAVVEEKQTPVGDFTDMAAGPDGAAYGVNAKCVARVPAEGASAEVVAAEGGKYAAVDGDGRVYFARGPMLLRCCPPSKKASVR